MNEEREKPRDEGVGRRGDGRSRAASAGAGAAQGTPARLLNTAEPSDLHLHSQFDVDAT